MRPSYSSFKEIKTDLKKLSLQRQIAYEEIKGLKYDVQEDFSSQNWIQTALGAIKKFRHAVLVAKSVSVDTKSLASDFIGKRTKPFKFVKHRFDSAHFNQ